MTGARNAWSDGPVFRVALCEYLERCMSPTARFHSFALHQELCLLVCHVPKATRQAQMLKRGEDHALRMLQACFFSARTHSFWVFS